MLFFQANFLTLFPQNIVIRNNGFSVLMDREWVMNGGIEFGHLVFRSLLLLLSNGRKFAPNNQEYPLTRGVFVKQVLDSLGVDLTEADFTRYMVLESAVRECVTGEFINDASNWWSDDPLPIEGSADKIQILTSRLERTEKALVEAQQIVIARNPTRIYP